MSAIEIAWTVVGIVVSIGIGAAFAVIGLVPPEFKVARICFWASAIVLGGMDIVWNLQTEHSFVWRITISGLIGAAIFVLLPEALRFVHRREALIVPPTTSNIPSPAKPEPTKTPVPPKQETAPPKSIQPKVALRFIYPNKPALLIVNPSDSVARNIKWTVVLWNMNLPDRNDPLPIPVGTFDFIRPHSEGGPQNLFDGPTAAGLVKSGDRLFGSASVDCPDCARGRTYVVYIVLGENGWFSEVLNEKSGRVFIPKSFDKAGRSGQMIRVRD